MPKAAPDATVAVLGASSNPERYSYRAMHELRARGYRPVPVHPSGHIIDGVVSLKSLDDLTEPPDTVTVYVSATISDAERDRLLRLKPRRVIFNPGAENPNLAEQLRLAGIEIVENCTLIMLRQDEF